MISVNTSTRPARWPIVVTMLFALAAMGAAVANDWSHYDDDLFLFRNPDYSPPTLATLGHYWAHGFRGLWTPITHTAWWFVARLAQLDVAESGGIRLNPWMFHAFNVLVHLMASALAFVLLRRAVKPTWAALAGAIVFAAHPIQVEAVAWACGTKDLLGTLFTIAAILAATSSRPRRGSVLCVVFAALAMLSKPSAVVLPAMIAVYAWLVDDRTREPGRSSRRTRGLLAITALLAIPVLIIARHVQDVADVPSVSLLARPIVALDALAIYLRHFAWPIGLATDYGVTPAQLLDSPRRLWTWLVPTAFLLAAWRSRDRALIGGALLAVIALAPNLGLAPFQFQVYSTVADRYAYPATIGAAIVVARLVATLPRAVAPIVAALLAIALVPVSFRYCRDWHDAGTLWSRTVRVNPASPLAHNNLGSVAFAAGDLNAAATHFNIAASAHGSAEGFALLNLAQLHLRLGDAQGTADSIERLITHYRSRSDRDPDLERQTIDRFAAQIARLNPAVATRLRERLLIAPPASQAATDTPPARFR